MAGEKRRYRRIKVRSVIARLAAPGVTAEGERLHCEVENVSQGGMFVRTDRVMVVGTLLQIQLAKRGWPKALELRGLVQSLREASAAELAGIGVRFVALSAPQQQGLQDLIAQSDGEVAATPEETPPATGADGPPATAPALAAARPLPTIRRPAAPPARPPPPSLHASRPDLAPVAKATPAAESRSADLESLAARQAAELEHLRSWLGVAAERIEELARQPPSAGDLADAARWAAQARAVVARSAAGEPGSEGER